MGIGPTTEYRALTNREVRRVTRDELYLGEGTFIKWIKKKVGMDYDALSPNRLEVQIEAILKLGASRNLRALAVLERLQRMEQINFPEEISASSPQWLPLGVEEFPVVTSLARGAYTLYFHPMAKGPLTKAYSYEAANPARLNRWERGLKKRHDQIDWVVRVAIDTLRFDLQPQGVELKPLKERVIPRDTTLREDRHGRGYTSYDPDPFYLGVPGCR